MVGKGNECAAASASLACLLLAAALSAGCCRAHAATARAPRSLLARFPTTTMTSELEKEAGRYVDDSSQAARTNNKITNLQVSFVGHGHDTPADGDAPFVDAAYPVKWSPRTNAPPKAPAISADPLNGDDGSFADAACPRMWVSPPGDDASPTLPTNGEGQFADAAYPAKWKPDEDPSTPSLVVAHHLPNGNAPFIDAAYPVKWSPRADGPPNQPATFPASPNGEKAEFNEAAYPVKWSPHSVAPPKAPDIFAQHSNDNKAQFTDATYPVDWSPRSVAPPKPPAIFAQHSNGNKAQFTDAAYPVDWSPHSVAPPKPSAIFAQHSNGNKAQFTNATYPVDWSPRSVAHPKPPAIFAKPPAIFAQHSNGNKAQFTDGAYPVDWSPRSVAPPAPPAALSSLAHPGIHIQRGMLFLMKKLHPGAVLPEGTKLAVAHDDHGVAAAAPRFIYKDKADAVPSDLRAMDAILAMFGILPGSDKAAQVADTLRACGELTAAGGGGEEPRACCATSREAVLDFAASALGTSAPRAVTTVVHGREPRRYVVAAGGVARIGGDAVVACHPMPYPYEVYYCHRPADAVALRVDLHAVAGVGLGGATAVAVCHVNTTTWDSAYFELLKASRGDAICHYMPQGYVLWLAN
uniref:BURP domain-containing protein n=1 Tax=Oryza meridionalis TaxID=40149 RepID=A0A0E0CJC1_9ORYZ